MGKRKQQGNSDATNFRMVEGKDTWKRLNFLYQAAHLYSSPFISSENLLAPSKPASIPTTTLKTTSPTNLLHPKTKNLTSVSRYLCSEFLLSAQKHTLRIDPEVKHTICSRCHSFLIYPFTCTFDMN
ncbi:hypothetical protein HMI54_010494, partial [Coelomomyces lativittatus]